MNEHHPGFRRAWVALAVALGLHTQSLDWGLYLAYAIMALED